MENTHRTITIILYGIYLGNLLQELYFHRIYALLSPVLKKFNLTEESKFTIFGREIYYIKLFLSICTFLLGLIFSCFIVTKLFDFFKL